MTNIDDICESLREFVAKQRPSKTLSSAVEDALKLFNESYDTTDAELTDRMTIIVREALLLVSHGMIEIKLPIIGKTGSLLSMDDVEDRVATIRQLRSVINEWYYATR